MLSDIHLHSYFSADSTAKPEAIIEQAISLSIPCICLTDHMDYDYPDLRDIDPEASFPFLFEPGEYFKELTKLKEQYRDKIELLIGIELGLQPHLAERCQKLLENYPFDFVIGSSHLVNGTDPYYDIFWSGRSEKEAFEEYFTSAIENIKSFDNFDVYGHLDYVVRYAPNKALHYSYKDYSDLIDTILRLLIEKGKGLEVNTAGFKYELLQPNPHPDILKRYRELGGEIITTGSDAHAPAHVGFAFEKTTELLKACGFQYTAVFKNRKPVFAKL